MKIKEFLFEAKVDFTIYDEAIFKNPSSSDTENLVSRFKSKAARFTIDLETGNVWMWQAMNTVHQAVSDHLKQYDKIHVDSDGFSFSGPWPHEGKQVYQVWGDSSSTSKDEFRTLLAVYPMVKRMFGKNIAIWDAQAGKDFWDARWVR